MPPYLSKGPQPKISGGPTKIVPGDKIKLAYTSADPVERAILIRTGATTHSMAFDVRSAWLTIEAAAAGQLTLGTPGNNNLLPPGMYMVSILSSKGVPSAGHILSVHAK